MMISIRFLVRYFVNQVYVRYIKVKSIFSLLATMNTVIKMRKKSKNANTFLQLLLKADSIYILHFKLRCHCADNYFTCFPNVIWVVKITPIHFNSGTNGHFSPLTNISGRISSFLILKYIQGVFWTFNVKQLW